MTTTVQDFRLILETFFPLSFPLSDLFLAISLLFTITPLLRLHLNQRRLPRQPANTAWMKATAKFFDSAFGTAGDHEQFILGNNFVSRAEIGSRLLSDVEGLFELLGLDLNERGDHHPLFSPAPIALVSTHLNCVRCEAAGNPNRALRKHEKAQTVRVLNKDFRWTVGHLFIARCIECHADYYPDRITFPGPSRGPKRLQQLEMGCEFIRVSKHGVWVHRRVALAQEHAVVHFHAGWLNFAEWLNETVATKPSITVRQSKRLFSEHFARRLLLAHRKASTFICEANLNVDEFLSSVREVIGKDGGTLQSALKHTCMDCTHKKRYRSDLLEEGLELTGSAAGVVELEDGDDVPIEIQDGDRDNNIPVDLPARPIQHDAPPEGQPRGYVRLAVMDGKSVGHRICALTTCELPLQNYRNGRFCREHTGLQSVCGIIPCGRPVSEQGALICDDEAHQEWYAAYQTRFKRLTFPGVQRVLRRQGTRTTGNATGGNTPNDGRPIFHVEGSLPALNGTPGSDVVHTFRAQTVYCVQTLQWACGMPIGWGKCYRSESTPQVLSILNRTWSGNEDSRPSYIAYDDACDLLRHIVTQNPENPWLTSTKFVVDAWHYIGHRATDALCRLWCNPAPMDGSQPDLIIGQEDHAGRVHPTRAFNTETAEQLNAWITRYEAQLRQMSDVTFDFFIHVLMMLYGESVHRRITKKERFLPEEFWEEVLGD